MKNAANNTVENNFTLERKNNLYCRSLQHHVNRDESLPAGTTPTFRQKIFSLYCS